MPQIGQRIGGLMWIGGDRASGEFERDFSDECTLAQGLDGEVLAGGLKKSLRFEKDVNFEDFHLTNSWREKIQEQSLKWRASINH